MNKNRVYAVRKGFKPGIYKTWDECKEQTHGCTGAEFKSFHNLDDAKRFMDLGNKATLEEKIDYSIARDEKEGIYYKKDELARVLSSDPNSVSVYTDGSCGKDDDGRKVYSGGFVVIEDNEIIARKCTFGDEPELAELNNVAGEMQAVLHALDYVKKTMPTITTINLFVDYTGLIHWAKPKHKGGWSRNNDYTRQYGVYLENMQETHTIDFEHVKGHINDPYNEEADTLATYSRIIHEEKREFDLEDYMENHSFIKDKDIMSGDVSVKYADYDDNPDHYK